jgi:hypothetical protein
MFKLTTSIPHVDKENSNLFKAAAILEEIGNDPNPTANQFYAQLIASDLPLEEHDNVILAAMAIETMMLEQHNTLEALDTTVH